MAEMGTVREVQVEWSIDDLADAHEALDLREEQQNFENKKIKENAGKR